MPPRLLSFRPHTAARALRPRAALSLPVQRQRPFTQSAPRASKGKSSRKQKRRQEAAAKAATAATTTTTTSSADPSQNLPWGIYRGERPLVLFPGWRKLVALGVTVFLGYLAAKPVREFLSPDTAASDEEEQAAGLGETAQRLDELPVVKALRAEEGWVEIARKPEEESADGKEPAGLVARRLAASAHLLGPRRVWWNGQRREGVSVGWAGPGVTGWPTVVHGGAIAAVVVEAVGLGWESERRGDKGPTPSVPESNTPPLPSHQPLQLDLTYLAPTRANEFYVLRFAPSPPAVPAQRGAETDLSPRKDMTKREADVDKQPALLAPRTEEWTATLEKALDGRVCVKARVVMPDHETKGSWELSDKSEGKTWRKRLWAN
ncbi:uncharacterized protein J3D65DRAFT_418717 [Phyllosticta citribraziliensis]|uniref:Mitochondrial import inner membrane translocase subunit Tim21 n=1 Tax=Phyllosticta citribraziliensis TaxID=989973 RepID=A0ABR1LMM7_9PEZI